MAQQATESQDGAGAGYEVECRRIQVSREKRPLNFFVTLTKKFLTTEEVVELSGLGLAVTTVVTIAELLKTAGLVSLDHIETSLVEPHPDGHTTAPKAKIQIWIRKTAEFESLMNNHQHHGYHYHMRGRRDMRGSGGDVMRGNNGQVVTSVMSGTASSGIDQDKSCGNLGQLEAGNTNPNSNQGTVGEDVIGIKKEEGVVGGGDGGVNEN